MSRTAQESSVAAAIARRLARREHAVAAASLVDSAQLPDEPGLYAWWADDPARATLADAFGEEMPALVYAGQAGAGSPNSIEPSRATLRSRIGSNHLRGNIGSSTFRRTLCAVVRGPLDLEIGANGRLHRESNARLSAWIAAHLAVGWVATSDRANLRRLEGSVLELLDPPLNLQGMDLTPVRQRLQALRADLGPTTRPPRAGS